jgi:ribosomal protein S18 acetylase RimI-like enzyme
VTQGLSFRPATALDGARYARDIGTDSAATFRGRLSSATRCFVVESEGRLLHASWVTTAAAWTREIGGYLRVPRGHAYVYESYTLAEARGRGIYPFALLSIAAWLSAEQVHTVWVAVEASNQASRRAVEKAGFEPRFQIHYRRHLGRLRVTTSGDGGDRLELAAPEKKHWAALLHSKRSQEKPQRG